MAQKRERKKQSHARADVAVVRRWLVSIGEAAQTRESLAAERALTPGQKLAARKRMDAYDARSRRRVGAAATGIGSVRKLNARTLDELDEAAKGTRGDEDEKKLAAMKRELAERLERRRRERDFARVEVQPRPDAFAGDVQSEIGRPRGMRGAFGRNRREFGFVQKHGHARAMRRRVARRERARDFHLFAAPNRPARRCERKRRRRRSVRGRGP